MGYTLVQRDNAATKAVNEKCNPKAATLDMTGKWVGIGGVPGSTQQLHSMAARAYSSIHLNEMLMDSPVAHLYIPVGGNWTIRWEQVATVGMAKDRLITVCAADSDGVSYSTLGSQFTNFAGNGVNSTTVHVNAWTPNAGEYLYIVLAAKADDGDGFHTITIGNGEEHDTLIELLPGGGRLVDRVPLGSLVDGGLVY